jgi:hypothetical protein
MTTSEAYEKLGVFYLGREARDGDAADDYLYESRDLTTHAVILGMTGSGKTGLGITLIEEAAIDGIPVIAIDPKGDLGNLLLTFPNLESADFAPWVETSRASADGQSVEEYAAATAKKWREGLAASRQSPERIGRFANAVERTIYTPGSTAGVPLTVLKSFAAPAQQVLDDPETFRDRVNAAASGLLSLAGIESDPLTGHEHVLLATILDAAWRAGQNLTIADLIRSVQTPPFDKVGVFDLETFLPLKERMAIALKLNALLASPGFAGWLEGEPLDVGNLLYTAEGKPRLSILSIAHLSDAERVFFVTLLLGEVLAWMRAQPGTAALRAILYMDEIAGFFPPVGEPPSKRPMLTLLKQARAYGLGVVLATQNPVDLDYKGLSNTGTWFLGRLQTERDKARVLEGLEGASATAGHAFDRQKTEAILAGLSSRTFLVNNVHEDAPVVITTRWALSYLRGPLTRDQISKLMANRRAVAESSRAPSTKTAPKSEAVRPQFPPDIEEHYLTDAENVAGQSVIYRPALFGRVKLHFVKSGSAAFDVWQERALVLPADGSGIDDWDAAERIDEQQLRPQPSSSDARFAEVPGEMLNAKSYDGWAKKLKSAAYRTQTLSLWSCPSLKAISGTDETERDFRIRLELAAREARERETSKLRSKYASKIAGIEKRIKTAEQRIDREKGQATRAAMDSVISIGSTLLGALFGRKTFSVTNAGRAASAARGVGRAAEQRSDVGRANETLEDLKAELNTVNAELAAEVEHLTSQFDPKSVELEELIVTPRKSDIQVAPIGVAWCPWVTDKSGFATPAWKREK